MRWVTDSAADLERAAEALRQGRLVAYPTETFYGLAADAWQPIALARLLRLKTRAATAPLPLILPDVHHLDAVAREVPPAARVLMERHWPGPLTLVLPARPELPAPLVGPEGVGVRVSSHAVASGLARCLDAPLVATSANPGGAPPVASAREVAEGLPGVELLVDGGPTAGGAPSTVVAVDALGAVRVLRQGAIHV